MTDTVVVEGQVRLREGKKWKNRWLILRKPSPVADCLSVLVYKDRSERTRGQRERTQATLGDICGLETLQGFEGVNYVLMVLCLSHSIALGFDSRETLLTWEARICYSLGEVHRFSVNVQPGTKLESGPATLHLCNNLLVIARDVPPTIIGQWRLSDLRRYGAVPNGFIFEGGTRCGYWTGVFFLACAEGEQISFLFDCIARGVSPSKAPFGLRPALPDSGANPFSAEERITQEACELEKRLSLLSVNSRQSSTASHSSYNTSLAGDDRSISSSSSDTSHSDAGMSLRLAIWPDPVRCPTPLETSMPPLGATAPKPLSAPTSASSEERLYGMVMGGPRPPSKPPRSRALQEAGRQSSTDSGIATGSHSSYSGSFSSYTGSLDTTHGETDEFGSSLSLSANYNANPNINTSLRLLQQFQHVPSGSTAPAYNSPLVPEHRLCACSVNGASQGQDSEYQVPSQVPQHYDTPRRLHHLHNFIQRTGATPVQDQRSEYALLDPSGASIGAASAESGERAAPPGGFPMPRHALCPVCGGQKIVIPSTPTGFPSVPSRLDKPKSEMTTAPAASEGMRMIISPEAEERSRYELMGGYAQQMPFWDTEGEFVVYGPVMHKYPWNNTLSFSTERTSVMTVSPMSPLRLFRQPSYSGRSLPLHGEVVFTFPERFQADSANYVNIPVSPVSNRQLHYMELDLQDLQEPGHIVREQGPPAPSMPTLTLLQRRQHREWVPNTHRAERNDCRNSSREDGTR
ncbi:protein Dok-7 isoform X3 [Brachyhypopomus gauderio]|uniref:protein Dok-7 isoform X3 n=1 Tax=Brachyhypopomus gauderio TaxID=698409 RepID=UPI00404375B0